MSKALTLGGLALALVGCTVASAQYYAPHRSARCYGNFGDGEVCQDRVDTARRAGIVCMFPDDLDSAGRRCGRRAASVRSGGF